MITRSTRYIMDLLAGPAIFIALCLTGIIWLTQALRFVDLIVNKGLSALMFMYLTLLLIPSLLGAVMPVAMFCAVVYIYNRLIMDSELIALENAGLSHVRLARPALAVAAAATLFGYVISLYLLPYTYREFKDVQDFVRNNYASILLQDGVFNTPADGLTVFIRESDRNGTMRGILVHDSRDPLRPVTMMAEEGKVLKGQYGPRFLLIHGNRQVVDQAQEQLSLLHFESYTLDVSLYAKEEQIRWREPEERYLHELLWPQDTLPTHMPKLRAEAHQRLTWPLYTLALALVGLAGVLSGQFNRRGLWRRVAASSLVAVLVVTVGIVLRSLAIKYTWMAPLMYLTPLLVSALAFYKVFSGERGALPQRKGARA